MAENYTINQIPYTLVVPSYPTLSGEDSGLIGSTEETGFISTSGSSVEFGVYDLNNNLLYYNSSYNNWSSTGLGNNVQDNTLSTIDINPANDVINAGYDTGQVYTTYAFYNNELGSSDANRYYISEISSNRTEIRIDNTNISNESLEILYDEFYAQFNLDATYDYFYLNFGSGNVVIATNVYLDKSSSDYSILIKLYQPLPNRYNLKTTCYVSSNAADPIAYDISFTQDFGPVDDIVSLQGPNTNLNINSLVNNSTTYQNYNTLTSTVSTSSLNQLQSLLEERGVEINIDYTDYSNFVFFSSAKSRLQNFYTKAKQIEDYNNEIAALDALTQTSSSSGSLVILQKYISDIITNFDGYEYYLYFESGSKAWPKTNSEPPYTLASTGSAAVLNWYGTDVYGAPYYGGQLYSASLYDDDNQDILTNSIPDYLQDYDSDQYLTFVKMAGQSFDNIWVYIKSISDKTNTDNRLDYGAPSGIIADILRSFGVNIYTNNFSVDNTYPSLLGVGADGQLYPTGSEVINTFVSASYIPITLDDVNKLTYKRLYHNLPYILKKKGTVEGLRALITLFGIPDTILRINEFGGKDKNFETWDNWQNEFNYAFYTSGSSYISSSWELNTNWNAVDDVPQAVEFRFKTDGLPQNTASIVTESLWSLDTGDIIRLRYTGSGYTTSSLISSSADPVDPYYQYALLEYIPDISAYPNESASIYLPFYDGGWWSVLLTKNSTLEYYDLYAANKEYIGESSNTIYFQASSSLTSSDSNHWVDATTSYFGSSSLSSKIFTGSFQEIRYYTVALSKSHFDAYVMNPYSIEGSDYLAFRATLGGELYTGSTSVHPKVTGSWVATSSFASNSTFYISGSNEYVTNKEHIYFDQVPAGIQTPISNKIRTKNTLLPYTGSEANVPNADVLSPFISIQQNESISGSYTADTNYVEIAFSPQNEINEDINSTLGYFNIGEYIGDPRQVSSSSESYPELDILREAYFEKYKANYDWWDFIRLIKYYDNSLFKILKDYTPARAGLSTGIVIKQHLLERNKYPVPQLDTQTTTSFSGSNSGWNEPGVYQDLTLTGSIEIEETIGSNGGAFIDYVPTIATSASFLIEPGQVGRIFLSQSGLHNVSFAMSSSYGGGSPATTALKVYDSASLPSSYFLRNTTTIVTSSLLSGYYEETFNFNYDFKSGYLLIANDNYSSSADITITSVTASSINGFSETTQTPSGSVEKYYTNEYEFNGELKGSEYVVTDGNLSNNTINFVEVFQTPLLPVAYTYPAPFFAPGVYKGWPRVTASAANLIDYNFEEDKTYYLSFTATGNPNAKLAVVNSNRTFANGVTEKSTSPYYEDIGLITLTTSPQVIDKFEVKGMNPKVYLLNIIGGATVDPINLSNFTVFEALPEDINNDPIINFVDTYRPSVNLFDVDYSQGTTIPVNQQVLLSGSATKATVPDSNYTMARSANPRYFGSRSTSPGFNQIPITGSGIGQLPNVEQTIPYFIYTPGGRGGTLAELSGSGNYRIGFVADEDGKVYKPNTTEGNVYSTVIYNNFSTNDQVVLSNISSSNFLNATQSYSIYKPLVNSQNILHSDTGSVGQNYLVNGYYDNISMSLAPGVNTSIKAKAIGPYEYNLPKNTETTASFNTPTINQANALTASTGLYIYPQGYTPLRGSITASMSYDVNDPGVGPPDTADVVLKIYKNGTEIASASKTSDTGSINNQHGISSSIYLSPGDTFYVTLNSLSNDLDRYDFNNYEVNPFTGSNSNYSIDIGSYYFTTGSNSQYILTASADMSYFYGGFFQQEELTSNNTSSGFGNPQPFVINPLDEIRFEGDESKVYVINSVEYDGINSILYLYLNSPIASNISINLDYFSIRRWAFSSDNLIIESGNTLVGPGLILPLYPTQKLKDNLDNIINQYQTNNLI
jgi:hypothetical protein